MNPGTILIIVVGVIGLALYATYSLKRTVKEHFAVVDEEKKLEGIIMMDDIREVMFNSEMYDKMTTQDLMNNPPYTANINDQPDMLMKKFEEYSVWSIPVVDDDGVYLGFISKTGMLDKYREKLIHSEEVKL